MWLFSRVVEPRTRTRSCIYSASLVLHIFEEKYPNDNGPRDAIKAARRWVNNPSDKNRRSAVAAYAATYAPGYAPGPGYAADTAADTAAGATTADKKELYIKIINHAIRLVKNGVKNEHNK